jgi:pentatricopeptide repeat protein
LALQQAMNGEESIITGMGASESTMSTTGHQQTPGNGISPHNEASTIARKRKPEDSVENGSSSSVQKQANLPFDSRATSIQSRVPPLKKRRSLDLLSAAAFGMVEMETWSPTKMNVKQSDAKTTDAVSVDQEEKVEGNSHLMSKTTDVVSVDQEEKVEGNGLLRKGDTAFATMFNTKNNADVPKAAFEQKSMPVDISKEKPLTNDDEYSKGKTVLVATADADNDDTPPAAVDLKEKDGTPPEANDPKSVLSKVSNGMADIQEMDMDAGNSEPANADIKKDSPQSATKDNYIGETKDEEKKTNEDQSENADSGDGEMEHLPQRSNDENATKQESLKETMDQTTNEEDKVDVVETSHVGSGEDDSEQRSIGDDPIPNKKTDENTEDQNTMKNGGDATAKNMDSHNHDAQKQIAGNIDAAPESPTATAEASKDRPLQGFLEATLVEGSKKNDVDHKVNSTAESGDADHKFANSTHQVILETASETTEAMADSTHDVEEKAGETPIVVADSNDLVMEETQKAAVDSSNNNEKMDIDAASGNEDSAKVVEDYNDLVMEEIQEAAIDTASGNEDSVKVMLPTSICDEKDESKKTAVVNDENDMDVSPREVDKETNQNGSSMPPSNADVDKTKTVKEENATDDQIPKTPQPQNGKKHVRKKHVDPEILEIRRRIQVGCRDNDLAAAMEAYKDARSKNIRLEAQSFYNLLNLCDGLERSVHIGTPKTSTSSSQNADTNTKVAQSVDNATRQQYAFQLKDHMKELNYPLNETAYSAIVKLLAKNKEFDSAETLLSEAEQVQQCKPKLRLYSSLLIAYCEASQMLDALDIWQRLTKRSLQITEREYTALMKCATVTGDSLVLQRVLTDLAEDILVPSKGTVASVLEWFELAHSFYNEALTKKRSDATKVKDFLEEIHKGEKESPPDMGPVVNVDGWRISSACPVDTNTGVIQTGCLKGCRLNPVSISQRAWDEMKSMNAKIVIDGEVEGSSSHFQGGKKGKKRLKFCPNERKQQWENFAEFLRSIGHVDVVIDGANVGKFEQNFADAPRHVDYNQINWVIRHFTRMGKKVLLVLHERHFNPNMMPDKYRPLQERWEREKLLYKSPRGMNDDWFWLHAAYSYKSLVVTNDEMRDHHFQMLAPRTFLRWKERHHIHFDFGDWTTDEGEQRQREVKLAWPEPYSRRIQRVDNGLVIPLAKQGDGKRFMDGAHVACDDEPVEETYLCIRPSVAK